MLLKANQGDDRTSQRAMAACEYCRSKKIKCDGAKPSCHRCRIQGRECTSQNRIRQPRPTNKRISHLEEENRRLQERLKSVSIEPRQQDIQDDAQPILSQQVLHGREPNIAFERTPSRSTESDLVNSSPLEQTSSIGVIAEAPEHNAASYHGPTSALFDDTSKAQKSNTEQQGSLQNITSARIVLVAETAKQRQLELINFASNSLDFDGVEPELGMQLLSLYWNRQLHTAIIVYRPAFMRDMACGGPYFSKLLLNAMYYSVSKHSPSISIRQDATDKTTSGWSFRQRFVQLLHNVYDKSSITTIQALLIMASSLFTRCDERSTSWLYAGNAFNMLIDIGLHVESPASREMTVEESEIRRKVFWAAYMIDKIQCLYQGRHPCLRISDTNVPLIFADDYEEFEKFEHISFCEPSQLGVLPSYNISIAKKLCELSVVMERIHSKVYALGHSTIISSNLSTESQALRNELEVWRKSLPPYLDFITSKQKTKLLPYSLSMLAIYNVLLILTHRLLLSESRSLLPHVAYEALITCMGAANEITHILRLYERWYNPISVPFSLSYATYIAATIHLHYLAQQGDKLGALDSLQTCLKALEKHQIIYSSAKRARTIITKLMTRMGIKVEENERNFNPERPDDTYTFTNSSETGQVDMLEIPSIDSDFGDAPDSSTPDLPISSLDFMNFDPDAMAQNFGSSQGMAESWLNAPQYTMFYDLYHGAASHGA